MDTHKPRISVVVVLYNMQREAPRTLYSLSPAYQQGISAVDYEVLVYENGSDKPLSQEQVDNLPANFNYHYIEDASPSPVFALNQGLREARGDFVSCMIDGARIATPGLLARALEAAQTHPRPVVAALGWYLGPDQQRHSLLNGYSTEVEDRLLDDINWPDEPYRLFEISVQDESSVDGWFSVISESNALFMPREQWQELGGYDEQFDIPGGGLTNLDTFNRACTLPDTRLIVPIDEATFHQSHGGTATNTPPEVQEQNMDEWRANYEKIRGKEFSRLENTDRILHGQIRPEMARAFARSLVRPSTRHAGAQTNYNLMGRTPFNTGFWCNEHYALDENKRLRGGTAFLKTLNFARNMFAHHRVQETRDICRMLLSIQPDDPEVTRLLRLCANVSGLRNTPPRRQARYHAAITDAMSLLGHEDTEQLQRGWRHALDLDPQMDSSRNALAKLELPGPDYYAMLGHLNSILQPGLYLEIGVHKGQSLSKVKPPAHIVGIDPELRINFPIHAESSLLPTTSDAFFASTRPRELLADGFDLAFLDGLHEFPQLVRDFWNAERYSKEDSVILLHDTIPLDDYSATRERQSGWWTGDVWKLLPLLQSTRPDLELFIIRTPPSGLAVVRGLKSDPVMSLEDFEKQAGDFDDLDVTWFRSQVLPELEQISNDFDAVTQRLQQKQPSDTDPQSNSRDQKSAACDH